MPDIMIPERYASGSIGVLGLSEGQRTVAVTAMRVFRTRPKAWDSLPVRALPLLCSPEPLSSAAFYEQLGSLDKDHRPARVHTQGKIGLEEYRGLQVEHWRPATLAY